MADNLPSGYIPLNNTAYGIVQMEVRKAENRSWTNIALKFYVLG